MRVHTIKKMFTVLFITIVAYIIIGNLLHRIIFPEQKPPVTGWFKPGQDLYSKAEGFRQTVVRHEDGHVHCTTEIEPFAGGPPKHIHTGFDEVFEIENGELTLWIDGEIKKIHPGEVLRVPKGTPHKPYNETAETIQVRGSIAFPEKFVFSLAQVYALMDRKPGLMESPALIFHMLLFQTNGFDAYVAEGPPVFMQKAMGFVMAPLLRVAGYKSYYKEYDPSHYTYK